jgi:hypothetical protein
MEGYWLYDKFRSIAEQGKGKKSYHALIGFFMVFFKKRRNYGPHGAMWRLSILGPTPDGHR